MSDPPLDRPEVDALYELDPSEFVPARDALAKELRTDGEREAATAVKKLRRPTKAAWAINQVARRHPDDIAALREAGEEIERRQAATIEGADPGEMRAAVEQRRAVVRRLVREVVDLAGESHADEATATFEAASLDTGLHAEVAAGRLTKAAPRPAGFGFGDLGAVPETPSPPRPDRRMVQRLERRVSEAEADLEEARDEVERAEERVAAAQRHADAARAKPEETERDAAEARAALEEIGAQ